jgi:hypothetical protein
MNKLVIIGNGFDLAHGLPTSYGDFINWFWSNIRSTYKDESTKQLVHIDEMNYLYVKYPTNCFADFAKNLKEYSDYHGYRFNQNEISCHKTQGSPGSIFEFKSDFFKLICKNHSIQNWVDIENEYYKLLKECLKETDNSKVKKLNDEFEQIKNLLERYLKEQIIDKYNFKKPNGNIDTLLKHFRVFPLRTDSNSYLEEFPKNLHKKLIQENNIKLKAESTGTLQNDIWNNIISENYIILNFNYTQSIDQIETMMGNRYNLKTYGKAEQIQIHGRLNDPDNEINFGFGDEMDSHYQEIEEKDDNEYLKYIKSFQYLQNSNYKKVLDFFRWKHISGVYHGAFLRPVRQDIT